MLYFLKSRIFLVFLLAFTIAQYLNVPPILAQKQPFAHAHILYVKFREQSPMLQAWRTHARKGSIDALSGVLGKHDTKPYVDDASYRAAEERLQKHVFETIGEQNPYPVLHELSTRYLHGMGRWCEVHLLDAQRADIAPMLAAKLEALPDVEIAECAPQRKADSTSNDPLVGAQQHLPRIRAFEAWSAVQSALPQSDTSRIIVGVVDTGFDYNHEDLRDVIFINQGESGMDALGRDRRTNGVDDDRNGKIDDWRGWDIAGTDSFTEDNDPLLTENSHGTHVAGILGAVTNNNIGVAGAVGLSSRFRLLLVKCGTNSGSQTIYNGARGVLYAATMGAQVINCSWGSASARSFAEQETIALAQRMGALVVVSAGNDGRFIPMFPSSYPDILSVGWLNSDDSRSFSSNFYPTVGISAPGSGIYATFVDNRYGVLSGTSMAAPQVTAAAALVKLRYPRMTAPHIAQLLKSSADTNDALLGELAGLLGTGRLNMLRAVQSPTIPSLALESYTVSDENNNGVLESGERIQINLSIRAGLGAVERGIVEMRSTIPDTSRFLPFWDDLRKQLPTFAASEIRRGAASFSFRLTRTLLENFEIPLIFSFRSQSGALLGRDGFVLVANQSYATMRLNNIVASVGTTGRLGYNEYPRRTQGDGVAYKPCPAESLIYDGGIMVASGTDSVSTSVRINSFERERSFLPSSLVRLVAAPDSSSLIAKSSFQDRNGATDAGVSVEQQVFQYRNPLQQNSLLHSFKITNTSERDFSKLFVGMFFDWDIGTDASRNEVFWDDTLKAGFVRALGNSSPTGQSPCLPVIALQMLSGEKTNFYPMVFFDTTANAPTPDFFTRSAKYTSLASGIVPTRKEGDVCAVIGAGPIALAKNSSTTVSFSLTIGQTIAEVKALLRGDTNTVQAVRVFPNPAQNLVFLSYSLPNDESVSIEIMNMLGQSVAQVLENVPRRKGSNQELFNTEILASGTYFVRVKSRSRTQVAPLVVVR
ncbi:MAG: T9SS C-terminal target domain-containing protein [Candidatus Kapaibacterium sp.]|nr:MAG: T9SS C-terminal target domain-containing protein [Candidatus Kapabacteria bacterium]